MPCESAWDRKDTSWWNRQGERKFTRSSRIVKSWEINHFFSRYRALGIAHCTRLITYVSTSLSDCLEAYSWQVPHIPALCLRCLPNTPPWSRISCLESQLSGAQVGRWAACSLCMYSAPWQQESKQTVVQLPLQICITLPWPTLANLLPLQTLLSCALLF